MKDRIDYLIKALAGNNAAEFSRKIGVDPSVVSRARNGVSGTGKLVWKICHAYPDVNREWLETGEGDPLHSMREKSAIIARLEELAGEVRRLSEKIELLRQMR